MKKFLWIGIVALTFFLPFERIGGFENFGFTIRPSQLILIVIIFGCALVTLREHRFPLQSLRDHPATLPLLGFFAVNLAGLTQSPNLERSIVVLGFTIFTMLLAWVVPLLISDERILRTVLIAILVSTGLVTIFGLFQFLGDVAGLSTSITGLREQYTKEIFGFPRIQSTSLEPLYFANFLLLPLALTATLILERQHIFKPWILWSILLLSGVNLILTVSRGGYLAAGFMALLLGLFYMQRVWNWKILGIGAFSILIVALSAIQFLQAGDTFQQNITTFRDHVLNVFSGASFVERLDTVTIAIDAFQTSPLIGRGAGSFGPLASYHPTIEPETGWQIVNNETMELLAETGLLGLLCLLALGVALLMRSIRAIQHSPNPLLRAMCIALTITLLGYAVQYQTFSVLYIMHIWFTVGLLVAVQHLMLRKPV